MRWVALLNEKRDGSTVIVYADPTVCDCLYIGDLAAYQQYRQEVQGRGIVD